MLDEYDKKVVTSYDKKASRTMAGKKKTLKINQPLRGYAPGQTIQIEVDESGVPLERYWRDRLKDAQADSCVELVKGSKK